ncbi:unnamed protein product [Rhodiola kirilowii]
MPKNQSLALSILFIFLVQAMWVLSREVRPNDLALAQLHEEWMTEHGRDYGSAEEREYRFKIFKNTVERVNAHNQVEGRSYDMAVNKFSDMTYDELKAKYTGLATTGRSLAGRSDLINLMSKTMNGDVPESVDWRKEGAVTEIKDQKECESCWAFAVVAAMEGATKIATGELISLSEQELVDCDYYDHGCGGGQLGSAYEWIFENGGLNTEEAYPYKAGESGTCNETLSSVSAANIAGFITLSPYNEKLLEALVAQQPVAIAIEASYDFFSYKSGVFTGNCTDQLNHGVAIVGYGATDDGKKYWIIKNSWGSTNWGEDGYGKMLKESGIQGGLCGLATDVSFPLVKM